MDIAADLLIDDRMETMAKKQAFITLKDHKENFQNNPACRLINPAKSEVGQVSKKILDRINHNLRITTAVNQWNNSTSVINWFKNLSNKQQHTFLVFDIVEYHPSITEDLLLKAINFAKQLTPVTDKETHIIQHARKSLLFHNDSPWVKKNNDSLFDVTMGSHDGAEICELVGTFLLNKLSEKIKKENIGLYRDDGLAVLRNTTSSKADRLRKDITKIFQEHGLRITVQTNLKVVDYLDITLNLNNETFKPYRKPNDTPMYINIHSNHSPIIKRRIPEAINKRVSSISSDESIFNEAAPLYNEALASSGYKNQLQYDPPTNGNRKKRNHPRNIIWFNPHSARTSKQTSDTSS
eukprot:gene19680-biopygen13943